MLSLEELGTYGFCPLQYRYRYELELPWVERSPEQAYHDCLRPALSRLLIGLTPRSKATEPRTALDMFDRNWEKACQQGGFSRDVQTTLLLEGHLALHSAARDVLKPGDTVIGGSFPTSVSVGKVAVSGTLDGLIMQADGTRYQRLLIVHLSNEKSPLWSPRFQPLKFQWGLEVVRKQLVYDRGRVGHLVFSPWTNKPWRIRDATPERAEFHAIVKSLAEGIRKRVYFQTPARERCNLCSYRNICSARHCHDMKPGEIRKLRDSLR